MIKFDIHNRFSHAVQFTAEIDCENSAPLGVKYGLAVKWAMSNGANLSGANLRGANLSDANLSDANLPGANLSGADLSGANLTGANLPGANLSGANLSDANLSDANLRGANLSGADLIGANLPGANLSDANLSGADLIGANLPDANLIGANLSGADWIPKIKNIHQAVYASASESGALEMATWHTCETTHCRAGWVTTLAGDGGKVLEGVYGPAAAAALIYQASDPTLSSVPNFYATNADALADMKRLAELEAAQ